MRRYSYIIIFLLLSNVSLASEMRMPVSAPSQESSNIPCHTMPTGGEELKEQMSCCDNDCSNCIISGMTIDDLPQIFIQLGTLEYVHFTALYWSDFKAYLYKPPIQI